MNDKIQALTSKLYREGVEKGEEKASAIVKEAQDKAREVVAGAEARAEALMAKAAGDAENLRRNVEAELRLAGVQAVDNLRQRIVRLVSLKTVEDPVGNSFMEPAVVSDFIRLVLQNWKAGQGPSPDLICLLPENKRKELEQSVRKAAAEFLAKGVEIRFSPSLKGGFRVGPKDGSYLISFTDEDFKEFFSLYLRPRTKAMLFGE